MARDQTAYSRAYFQAHKDDQEFKAKRLAENAKWKKTEKGRRSQSCSNRTVNGRYRSLRFAAKRIGLGFSISKDEHALLLLRPCFYCRGPLPETGSGLDRIDNDQGYLTTNVVPCCTSCNRIKNQYLTHSEMIVAMDAVLRLRSLDSL